MSRARTKSVGAWLGLAALAAGVVLWGCSPQKAMLGNLPPETTLFVQGEIDPVNHVVHLYWFGTDPDGEVSGFEWRFLNPSAPEDSLWRFTARSDSVFSVYTPTGQSTPVFEVRAIDNASPPLTDPSPARQDFTFNNRAPVVLFTNRFGTGDTTFAAATLTWNATDPDGDAMQFLVWLDGNRDGAELVSGNSLTLPAEDFCRGGFYTSGTRKAFIQPVDEGGMLGNVDSVGWYVKAPVGTVWPCGVRAKLLIVDDVAEGETGNTQADNLYRDAARRALGPDSAFRIVRRPPAGSLPFRSSQDVQQTFGLYETVIWYRDILTFVGPALRDFQSGIGGFVDQGGTFYLDGQYLYAGERAAGALNAEFQRDYLHADSLAQYYEPTIPGFTASWGTVSGTKWRSSVLADSLQMGGVPSATGSLPGIRAFGLRDTNEAFIVAPDSTLAPRVPRRMVVGVSTTPNSEGGRVVALSFPLRAATPGGNIVRLVDKIFAHLGIVPGSAAGTRATPAASRPSRRVQSR